jgi:small ligand-binding sensory domain FIST
MLQFGAAVSTKPGHSEALDEVVPAALATLDGPPDLAVCFVSVDHAEHATSIAMSLSERTGTANLIGCTGDGVISDGRELEAGPAVSLWVARLPGVDVRPFSLRVVSRASDSVAIAGWPVLEHDDPTTVLMLAEPFSFPTDRFLEHLNGERPGLTVIGGLASGGLGPGQHRLLTGGPDATPVALSSGAVGVALTGPVEVRTLVSQGCRPIGQPFTVTKGDGNVIHELGGRPAVDRLKELITELDPGDQVLLRGGALLVGQVVDEQKLDYDRGDFLIRPLAGADPGTGAIALGDEVTVGQTLQFHLRDAAAADE